MCDVMHPTPRRSVYDRTDYLVNSDMTIPLALAGTYRFGVITETARRLGLPDWDRRPAYSPLVLQPARIPLPTR